MKQKLAAAFWYCVAHKKQLAAAVTFGMGLLETIQHAH